MLPPKNVKYPFYGAVFIPENAVYRFAARAVSPTISVWLKCGRRLGFYQLNILSQMYGRGWFLGVLNKYAKLSGFTLLVPKPQFFWEYERIVGPEEIAEENLIIDFCNALMGEKICSRCHRPLKRLDFPDRPDTTSDAFGTPTTCTACHKEIAHRVAADASMMRRVREKYAEGEHTDEEWSKLLDTYGRRCLRCNADGDLTKDHVRPLALGGSDRIQNLQPLCRSCNSWKGAREIDFRDNFIQEPSGLLSPPDISGASASGEV